MNKQVDSIVHKHDWIQIHPNDPIGAICKLCGKATETNPYTGEVSVISKKEVEWRRNHFEDMKKEREEQSKKYPSKQYNNKGQEICGAWWCNKVLEPEYPFSKITWRLSEYTFNNASYCSISHMKISQFLNNLTEKLNE